jgi:hypothetical protein
MLKIECSNQLMIIHWSTSLSDDHFRHRIVALDINSPNKNILYRGIEKFMCM